MSDKLKPIPLEDVEEAIQSATLRGYLLSYPEDRSFNEVLDLIRTHSDLIVVRPPYREINKKELARNIENSVSIAFTQYKNVQKDSSVEKSSLRNRLLRLVKVR